ncbi:MAG TPA: hypothetical protein VGZ73_23695 [Bryobacteraceae bacterium]|jgi:hypothetical protein|nr:hypothetical protein [Bryobacteraceae bacterium]
MSSGRLCTLSTLAVAAVLALPADAQSVISARSGVVHFFEGAVYLGDQPLVPHLGKFTCMAEGAELRTAQGRAEVLLTPGVFLRMDQNSAIRLVGNDLSDTRVELLAGSAIVDSAEPGSGTSVTLNYKDWKVHFIQKGIYRIDAALPRVWVYQGEAEVSSDGFGAPVSVARGMDLPLASVLVPERSLDVPGDSLSSWAQGRSESISADNAIAAQIDEDPALRNSDFGADSFTYFPLIGVPSFGLGSSGAYGSYYPYQLGFNSIYLPGYTYRPVVVGLSPAGYGSYFHAPPRHIGISPGVGIVGPAYHPPTRPAPAHPIVHGPVHVGRH